MHLNGKIVGLLIGLFFGYPGAIIGLIIGHLYDIGFLDKFLARHGHRRSGGQGQTQQTFFDTTFAIMGYVAKSDGRVTESEIKVAREVMRQLGLTGSAKERAIKHFYHGKSAEFDLNSTIIRLRQACMRHPTLLRTFVEIQVYMANAEGKISPHKRATLQSICEQLGIRGFNFHQYEQQSRAEQNYQRYYHGGGQQSHQSQYSSRHQIDDAYKILEVEKSANKEEVKKAYRRQMSKHHPDKLSAKGLPPEMIKLANQKTDQIKKAYDAIKAMKGW
ncbi:MAG: co-chaperone DjlA [Coxiella sp. (in: Bacteria)]|nr:MAG: co-chaperone DjlA [Coxiella sp. (in: g-proteobacteria)]